MSVFFYVPTNLDISKLMIHVIKMNFFGKQIVLSGKGEHGVCASLITFLIKYLMATHHA